MEGAPKIEKQDNNLEEKKGLLERFKENAKPMFKYGLLTLIAMKSFNLETVNNPQKQDKKETATENAILSSSVENNSENTEDTCDTTLMFEGENGFNYYNPEILKDFETFYSYAIRDEGFLEQDDLDRVLRNHSQKTLDRYIEKMKESEINSEDYLLWKEFVDDFKVIESEDDVKEAAFEMKYKRMKVHVEDIRNQEKWLKKIIGSDVYLERLAKETDGDIEKAKELQQGRLNRLENHDFYLSNDSFLSSVHSDSRFPGGSVEAAGHVSNYGKHKYEAHIHNDVSSYSSYSDGEIINHIEGTVPLHEFDHQILLDLMTEKSYEIYKNLFSECDLSENQLSKIEYYKNPLELSARKRELEYELEKLGIKKYEEEFSTEHYKEVQKLLEEGKLQYGSEEFFRSYEKDSLMLIMNTVAETIDNKAPDTINWEDAVRINNKGIA